MDQEKALALLKTGENVFLTGAAGAGKTYLLKKYINHLRDNNIPLAITASTGIAATHLNGQTIHSWSGVGIKKEIDYEGKKNLYKKPYLRKAIEKTKVLIIDEISMLHQKQFMVIDEILRFFKGLEAPFGGIQLVVSGDFFQLPPVDRDTKSAESRDKFVFMSQSWVDSKMNICYLETSHRQKENKLIYILNAIRNNTVDDRVIDDLEQACKREYQEDIPQLLTHNKDIDLINNNRLNNLETQEKKFTAVTDGTEKQIEILSNNVNAPQKLLLKEGARVIFVKNNPDTGYMNGTLGYIKRFSQKNNQPVVITDDGATILVEPETWQIEDEEGKVQASYKQIPLRLAWAITIHKSQGMTLEKASVNLKKCFEKGQGYVALSRLKSFDKLILAGYNSKSLQVDPLAAKADRRFRELSVEAENKYTQQELDRYKKSFISENKQKK